MNQLIIKRLEKNQGHGIARSIAIKNTSYELVAIMDADDIADKYRFEKQIACFQEDKELSVLGGQISEFINQESNIIAYRNVPTQNNEIYNYIKKRCPFNQMTVMFRKKMC